MSSWANIRVPRKRNLSQIPEDLRPTIIPRTERPEVVNSELYHIQEKLESFGNFDKYEKSDKSNSDKSVKPENPRQYVTTKIDTSLKLNAYELKYKEQSYVFVILRNIRTVRDNDLWISSYNSIRKFYTNKIIIIDDNSTINTVNGKLTNTEIIQSEFNGAGEILPYYYFLMNKWADRMIFLHDSMFINRPFRDNELEGIKFHWHFTTNVNDSKKILRYISLLKNNKKLSAFIEKDSTWKGCFGGASIIDLKSIEYLEEEYSIFTSVVLSMKTRKDRELFERLLGIVLYYEDMVNENCSNFGDIIVYPGAFESNTVANTLSIVNNKGYDTAIIKVWRGR